MEKIDEKSLKSSTRSTRCLHGQSFSYQFLVYLERSNEIYYVRKEMLRQSTSQGKTQTHRRV